MLDIYRLYHIAVDLKPTLPPARLMALLPKKEADLIRSGIEDGLVEGMANYATLEATYMEGANGIDSTDREFRALLCAKIQKIIQTNVDLPLSDRMKLQGALSNYYTGSQSTLEQRRVRFDTKPTPLHRFKTGLEPLDEVLGGKGITKGVITLIAVPGTGKTFMGQALCNIHDGPAWMFDPETGEDLILDRQVNIKGIRLEEKEYFFGSYDIEDVYEQCRADPDPNRLVVFDSLHFVYGDGSTPDSRVRYGQGYKYAIRMVHENLCKYVLITTQVKRGNSGDDIDSAAASSAIERDSSALVNLRKEMLMPSMFYRMRFYCSKNRMGEAGRIVNFEFDYNTASVSATTSGGTDTATGFEVA